MQKQIWVCHMYHVWVTGNSPTVSNRVYEPRCLVEKNCPTPRYFTLLSVIKFLIVKNNKLIALSISDVLDILNKISPMVKRIFVSRAKWEIRESEKFAFLETPPHDISLPTTRHLLPTPRHCPSHYTISPLPLHDMAPPTTQHCPSRSPLVVEKSYLEYLHLEYLHLEYSHLEYLNKESGRSWQRNIK